MYFKSLCLASSAQKASCHSTPGHFFFLSFCEQKALKKEQQQKQARKSRPIDLRAKIISK